MKLYYIPQAAPAERWQGTQADAKRVGGKGDFQREVPTDKPNLLAFLNGLEATAPSTYQEVPQQLDELEQAELRAVEAARGVTTEPSPVLRQTYEVTEIEDFILNRATVDQASNIFACLGTRFKELANGTA